MGFVRIQGQRNLIATKLYVWHYLKDLHIYRNHNSTKISKFSIKITRSKFYTVKHNYIMVKAANIFLVYLSSLVIWVSHERNNPPSSWPLTWRAYPARLLLPRPPRELSRTSLETHHFLSLLIIQLHSPQPDTIHPHLQSLLIIRR